MDRQKYDYIISIGIDKEATVKDYIKSMKAAAKQIEAENKNIIRYQVEPDKENFMKSLTNFLSGNLDLSTSILIEPDTSSFKRGLEEIDNYAKKNAKQISKDFKDEFKKDNVLDIREILGLVGNEKVTPNKIKSKVGQSVNTIKDALNAEGNALDVTKLVNYEDFRKVTNAAKDLSDILKQLPTTKNKGLFDPAETKEIGNLIEVVKSGYGEVFKANSETFKEQLNQSKADVENSYQQIQQMLLLMIKYAANAGQQSAEEFKQEFEQAVNSGSDGIANALSGAINQGVEQGIKSVEQLEAELEELKKIQISYDNGNGSGNYRVDYVDARDELEDATENGAELKDIDENIIANYIDKVRKFVSTLSVSSEEYKEVEETYKSFANMFGESGKNVFLPISSMETYEKTLERIHDRQSELIRQISNAKKQVGENGGIEGSGTGTGGNGTGTGGTGNGNGLGNGTGTGAGNGKIETVNTTKIQVDNKEALESISVVKEALEKLPQTKTIEIILKGLESGELQKAMANWSSADNMMADVNTDLRERFALFNDNTGYISNPYLYSMADEVTEELIKSALESAKGQANSMIHSHGIYNVAALSPEDFSMAITALNDNITKSYVMGLKEVSVLDISSISEENRKTIESAFYTKYKEYQNEILSSLKGSDLEKGVQAQAIGASDEFQNKVKALLVESIKNVGLNPEDIYKTMSISDFTNSIKSDKLPNFDIELKARLSSDFNSDIQKQIDALEPKPTIDVRGKIVNSDELLKQLGSDITNSTAQSNKINNVSLEESTEYVDSLVASLKELAACREQVEIINHELNGLKPGENNKGLVDLLSAMQGAIDDVIKRSPELESFKDIILSEESAENFINTDNWKAFLATLSKAHTYLESIGYDLNQENKLNFSTKEEIDRLQKLLDKINDIKKAIEDKTEAFGKEETAVGTVVTNEVNKLTDLEKKVDNISESINTLISKLQSSENTNVIFTPMLSNDFDNIIKNLISDKTFELNLVPVVNNTPATLQGDNSIVGVVDEQTERMKKEIEAYNRVIKQATTAFLNGAQASPRTKGELNKSLAEMVANNSIDTNELYEILKNDSMYVAEQMGSHFTEIKKYLIDNKIRFTDQLKSEFGDEWNDILKTFTGNILSKSKGKGIDVLYPELKKLFPEIPDASNNTPADMFRSLYKYMRDTPNNLRKQLEEWWKSTEDYDAEVQKMNSKLAELTKNAIVPENYLGETSTRSLGQFAKPLGKQLGLGYAEGIREAIPEIAKACKEIVEAANEAIKNAETVSGSEGANTSNGFVNNLKAELENSLPIFQEAFKNIFSSLGNGEENVDAFGNIGQIFIDKITDGIKKGDSSTTLEETLQNIIVSAFKRIYLGEAAKSIITGLQAQLNEYSGEHPLRIDHFDPNTNNLIVSIQDALNDKIFNISLDGTIQNLAGALNTSAENIKLSFIDAIKWMREANELQKDNKEKTRERQIFYNSKTGEFSNPTVIGDTHSVGISHNILATEKYEHGRSFDTDLHWHRDNDTAAPSPADLVYDFVNAYNEGINKFVVGAQEEFAEIDFSKVASTRDELFSKVKAFLDSSLGNVILKLEDHLSREGETDNIDWGTVLNAKDNFNKMNTDEILSLYGQYLSALLNEEWNALEEEFKNQAQIKARENYNPSEFFDFQILKDNSWEIYKKVYDFTIDENKLLSSDVDEELNDRLNNASRHFVAIFAENLAHEVEEGIKYTSFDGKLSSTREIVELAFEKTDFNFSRFIDRDKLSEFEEYLISTATNYVNNIITDYQVQLTEFESNDAYQHAGQQALKNIIKGTLLEDAFTIYTNDEFEKKYGANIAKNIANVSSRQYTADDLIDWYQSAIGDVSTEVFGDFDKETFNKWKDNLLSYFPELLENQARELFDYMRKAPVHDNDFDDQFLLRINGFVKQNTLDQQNVQAQSQLPFSPTLPQDFQQKLQDAIDATGEYFVKLYGKLVEDFKTRVQEEINKLGAYSIGVKPYIINSDSTEGIDSSSNEQFVTSNESAKESAKKSNKSLSEEARLFNQIAESAKKAAENKQLFAEANKEVLKSIVDSLIALNSEGEGFNNLNKLIGNLANNKEDRITKLVGNVARLRDALNEPVNSNAFIDAIKDIASHGEDLKDLATVLRASKKQIEDATKGGGKTKKDGGSSIKKDVKSAEKDLTKLGKRVEKLGNQELTNQFNSIKTALKDVGDDADKLKAVNDSMADLSAKTTKAETETQNLANDAKHLVENYKELKTLYGQLNNTKEGGKKAEEIQKRIDALNTENEALQKNVYTKEQQRAIDEAQSSLNIAIADSEDKKAQATEKSTKETEKASIALENRRQALLLQASTLLRNGKINANYGQQIREMINDLSDTEIPERRLGEIANKFREIRTQANLTGKTGKTLFEMLKGRATSLVSYLGTFASFYRIVSYVRTAFSTIKELDTQLVDLRKTTTMTTSELEQFYKESSNVAKQLGVTTSEIISQSSAWSRLGYSSREAATEMAKLSSQFASISPGVDTDAAQTGLVSIMKAWDVDVDRVSRDIMDNINVLGNNFAETNGDIITGMEKAGATLSAIGTSIQDSFALFTGAQEVLQNAETVGTAMKTLSLRIRGKNLLPPYGENHMLCA